MKMRLELTIMVVMLALFSSAKAQKVAVKTDLINDVCLSPNFGMDTVTWQKVETLALATRSPVLVL